MQDNNGNGYVLLAFGHSTSKMPIKFYRIPHY